MKKVPQAKSKHKFKKKKHLHFISNKGLMSLIWKIFLHVDKEKTDILTGKWVKKMGKRKERFLNI